MPIAGVVVAAFCAWLTVRIINRNELWAKRTGVALAVVLVYVFSIGPACRMEQNASGTPAFYAGSLWGNSSLVDTIYAPLEWASDTFPFAHYAITWYVSQWV